MVRINISFDGNDLTDYIYITDDFTLLDGADFSPTFENSFNDIDGSAFITKKNNAKTIDVPFALVENPTLIDSYNYLMKVLNVDSPKELRFSNLPGKYYMAIPQGQLDLDEYQHLGIASIQFVVPSGVAYSDTVKEFIAVPNSNGVLQANVINNGTRECAIDYEITHHSDNGFIGIVSDEGAIQLGSSDDVDVIHLDSDVLVDSVGANISASNKAFVPYKAFDYLNTGTVGTFTRTNVYRGCTNYNYTSGKYNGIGFKIPFESSRNFQAWFKTIFETSKANQTGLLMLTLASGSTPIASIVVSCTSTSSAKRNVEFYCNGSLVKSYSLKDNKLMGAGKGNCYIYKEGSKFTFNFEEKQATCTPDGFENVTVDSVNVYIGSKTKNPVAYMGVNLIKFQQNSADKIVDVPNRYSNGTVVSIDGNSTKVYVNDVLTLEDEVLGSTYFKAKKGVTPILFNFSDWITTNPTVKVRIREEFI